MFVFVCIFIFVRFLSCFFSDIIAFFSFSQYFVSFCRFKQDYQHQIVLIVVFKHFSFHFVRFSVFLTVRTFHNFYIALGTKSPMKKKSIINFHHKLIMDYGSHYILKFTFISSYSFVPYPSFTAASIVWVPCIDSTSAENGPFPDLPTDRSGPCTPDQALPDRATTGFRYLSYMDLLPPHSSHSPRTDCTSY